MITITLNGGVDFFIDAAGDMGFRKNGQRIVVGHAHRADFDEMVRCILRLRIHTEAHPDVSSDHEQFNTEG